MKNKGFIIICPLGSVDTANNRRDNLTSYHDIISTERWEMRFLGYILGICEANAFNFYKVYAEGGNRIVHGAFKDRTAYSMLKYCEKLLSSNNVAAPNIPMALRSSDIHLYVAMRQGNTNKRRRLVCQMCKKQGVNGIRIGKRCSCDPITPMCKKCHIIHLRESFQAQSH
jgi:hypothetical protein